MRKQASTPPPEPGDTSLTSPQTADAVEPSITPTPAVIKNTAELSESNKSSSILDGGPSAFEIASKSALPTSYYENGSSL